VRTWLLLIYKIPREPTAGRVYVWRKLKQLGAVALQDAVWVLPRTARTQEQFQWISAEITELGGDATLLSAEQLYATDFEGMKKQFVEPVEAEYREILAALEEKDRDLSALSKRFKQIQARDYFASELGRQVRERLLDARGGAQS
jgi:DNA-binding transcriptional regulator PaaX